MTVAELIAELQKWPAEEEIWIDFDEYGMHEPGKIARGDSYARKSYRDGRTTPQRSATENILIME